MARPKTEINKEQFESLCNLQCTVEEIAGFFKCNRDTVDAWCKRTYNDGFSAVFKKYSQNGKISLRRYQYKLAERNTAMAIWLGKQWLGQTDKIETVNSFEDLSPLADMLQQTEEITKLKEQIKELEQALKERGV